MEYNESNYNGLRRLDFVFEGRAATLIFPREDVRTDGWMMKMEYFGAFPETEHAMLARGYHLAYLKNLNRWGTDADHEAKCNFADFLHREFGLRRRFIAVGMSCGGYHSVNFASRHPEYVECLYLDAPLLSMASLISYSRNNPAQSSEKADRVFEEMKGAYGFRVPAEVFIYNDNPVNRLPKLVADRIPVALVYGDADMTVDCTENAEILLAYYKEFGGNIKAWCKSGCDHHPHGMPDPTEVCDWMLENGITDRS